MIRYACANPSCPKREPVTAETAPTCYTCGRTMAEVAPVTYDPARAWLSFDGVRVNGEIEGPFIEIPEPTTQTVGVSRAQPMAEVADWTPSTSYEVDQRVVSDGQVYRVTHVELVDTPPNRECRLDIPEPTPEQCASRTLPPITIEVTPAAPADVDVEAFLRDLQAEILRALTTIDRVPHDQPVSFRNETRTEESTP